MNSMLYPTFRQAAGRFVVGFVAGMGDSTCYRCLNIFFCRSKNLRRLPALHAESYLESLYLSLRLNSLLSVRLVFLLL